MAQHAMIAVRDAASDEHGDVLCRSETSVMS